MDAEPRLFLPWQKSLKIGPFWTDIWQKYLNKPILSWFMAKQTYYISFVADSMAKCDQIYGQVKLSAIGHGCHAGFDVHEPRSAAGLLLFAQVSAGLC